MKSPLSVGPLVKIDVIGSTQDEAIRLLHLGSPAGVVHAIHQTAGRGRFQRKWESESGSSLTVSFAFELEADQTQPWLVGMTVACAVASAFQIQVQWPNDLVIQDRKVGGILTEIASNSVGKRFAIIGLGLNLLDSAVPITLANTAASLESYLCKTTSPNDALEAVLRAMDAVPEPNSWSELKDVWASLDSTRGKVYKSPEGRTGIAIRIGDQGELLADFGGTIESVFAADALLGTSSK